MDIHSTSLNPSNPSNPSNPNHEPHQMFAHLSSDQRERIRQMIHSTPFLQLIESAIFPQLTSFAARLDSLTPPDQTNYARGYKAALSNFMTLVCTFAGLPNPLRAPLHWLPDSTELPSPPLTPQVPDDPPSRGSYGSGRPAFPA